jgi:hypothetical protein
MAAVALLAMGCVEDEYISPEASFELYSVELVDVVEGVPVENFNPVTVVAGDEYDTLVVALNQELEFRNTGSGTHFSLWYGDGNSNYFGSSSNVLGTNFPVGSPLRHTYGELATHKLIMWATSLNSDDPSEYSRDSKIYFVKVMDMP